MAKQVEMPLDSFERDLVQGSTKKAMSGSKSRDLWQVDPRELKFMSVGADGKLTHPAD
ncbi:TPA: hypothetical protein SL372_003084 [Pseudomonas aeruginosa]|nr:hypothetical protein [Pseudomonas aeruginosa]